MAVITTFDVVDCNQALAEAGFSGSVHLHDACGAQSLSWDASLDSGPEPVGPWLERFFSSRGATVRAVEGRRLVAGR